jgi:hypothetical protein
MQCYSCKQTGGRSRRKNNTDDEWNDDADNADEYIININLEKISTNQRSQVW